MVLLGGRVACGGEGGGVCLYRGGLCVHGSRAALGFWGWVGGGAGVERVALEGACECWWPVVCGRRSCVVAILAGVSYLWECRVSDSGSGRARGVCWLWALQGGACGDGGPVLCAAVGLARRCWGPYWEASAILSCWGGWRAAARVP